jgi:hypothetical protein
VVSAGPAEWGTNTWWSDQDAALWTGLWTELGPSTVRIPVSHAAIEPQNDNADAGVIRWGGYQFETPISIASTITRTVTYRDLLEALRDQPRLRIMLHFSYLAPWLSDNSPHPQFSGTTAPYPPNDTAEYREFVEVVLRFAVDTVGIPATRVVVEAANEPDLGCGVDPVTPCFWDNWTMADVANVIQASEDAILAVDSDITLAGMAECCGTSIARALLDGYPQGDHLDSLSFHYYAQGYDLDVALNRASELRPYGLPVYLDEYGSRQYHSDGPDGALWHAWALPRLWAAGIAPVQYPISEWPWLGDPYSSMGLLEDWRGNWERKPAYWVYASFFRLVGGTDVISSTGPAGADLLVTRATTGTPRVVFWIVNRSDIGLVEQTFAVDGFPGHAALLTLYDTMVASTGTQSALLSGVPLVFRATLPALSSRAFVLRAVHTGEAHCFLPTVLRKSLW